MISRVNSENKESRPKGKSIKKQRLNRKKKKKKTVLRNIKHRRREWNPVHLHVQVGACTLQYSDTHDLKKLFFFISKTFLSAMHRRCSKLVELFLAIS